MQMKTTVRYHFIHTRTAIVKMQAITSVSEYTEEMQPSYIASGSVKWFSHCGKQLGSSSKS